jgi:hypothetical protein
MVRTIESTATKTEFLTGDTYVKLRELNQRYLLPASEGRDSVSFWLASQKSTEVMPSDPNCVHAYF